MTKARHPNITRSLEFLATLGKDHPEVAAGAAMALDIAAWLEPLGRVMWSEVLDRYGTCAPPEDLEKAIELLSSCDLAGVRTTLHADGRRTKRLKWLGDS